MSTKHVICPGEGVSMLAEQHGLFPKTIWDHPENKVLRERRTDMNILLPGDVLIIPDRVVKEVSKGSDQRHRFRRKGVPALLRFKLENEKGPRRGVAFRLDIDGALSSGKSDDQGVVEIPIPPGAQQGRLILSATEEFSFEIGGLAPVTTDEGIRHRLRSLALLREEAGDDPDELKEAIIDFKRRYLPSGKTPPDGAITEPVRKKLLELHGS